LTETASREASGPTDERISFVDASRGTNQKSIAREGRPRTWGYNLGPLCRIPSGGRVFVVAARMVAVFRTGSGQLFARGLPVGNGCAAPATYRVEVTGRGDIQLYVEDR
jgi:hypothetical protein